MSLTGRENEAGSLDGRPSRAELQRGQERAFEAEEKLVGIESSRAWRLLQRYRGIRSRIKRSGPTPSGRTEPEAKDQSADISDGYSELSLAFEDWTEVARNAVGDEVVVVLSDIPLSELDAGHRSGHLVAEYLRTACPVLFTYGRTRHHAGPERGIESLLMRSPIDLTHRLLPQVLEADFGDKRKVLFITYPLEVTVRYMAYASQHGWSVVYDVQADWEALDQVGAANRYVPAYEYYIATTADVVTAVSVPLANKIEVLSGRQVDLNANAHDPLIPIPAPSTPPERPVLGYIGPLTNSWLNWDLLLECARRYPEIDFELAGHGMQSNVKCPDNVAFRGPMAEDGITQASSRWTGAILPGTFGSILNTCDPLSVYTYLHWGLPVLATYIPQILTYPGVTVTESPEAFVAAIPELAMTGRHRPGQWLSAQTWETRVASYREALAEARPQSVVIDYLLGRTDS